MSVFHNNALIGSGGGAAADTAADIPKSLRFNSADSAYLGRTPSSASNRKTWTWSGWLKRSKFNVYQVLWSAGFSGSNYANLYLMPTISGESDFLSYQEYNGTVNYQASTDAVFRDPASFYHIVWAFDSTQSTASDRVKLYVNNQLLTVHTVVEPSQNYDSLFNSTNGHSIGRNQPYNNMYLDGYLSDIHFIDGSALTPSAFGAYDDNGVWQAAGYSGTYGTNGFHLLDFANESTIGHDSSGNNNDFTAYNLSPVAGDPSYLTETTLSGSIYSGAGGKEKIFDGTTATAGPNQGSSITFTPSPSITISSSLRIRANVSNVNGDAVLQINGSNYQTSNLSFPASGNIGNAASTWVTIPSPPSTLTSLRFGWEAHWIAVSGIEIDGVELLSDPGALDILFDSPVNGDQSDTGNGGEVSGNYATWNPLGPGGTSTYGTFSNGNLDASLPASGKALAQTIFPESGKWYCEMKFVSGGGAGGGLRIGVINENNIAKDLGSTADSWAYLADGRKYHNGSAPSYGVSSAPGDTLMMCLDIDAGKLWFGKNGSWMASGNPAAGSSPSFTFTAGQKMSFSAQSGSGTVQVITTNWGQREWLYNAPSGFKALCTANLPTPTIADGSDYFDVSLWTGNGSTQSITGLSFSPDLVWAKTRSVVRSHVLCDTIRGTDTVLSTNYTDGESGFSGTGYITAFNSDGFSVGAQNSVNQSSATLVAWTWDAGSSTVSNTDGTITSSVRVNQTAGFSIVSYTGTGAAQTTGHGLNATPALVILKNRDTDNTYWQVFGDGFERLQLAIAQAELTDGYTLARTSTTISPTGNSVTNNQMNANGDDYIAYCFAPVAGFSSFGSYEGTGNSDGPFVHTGFRIRWLMIKAVDYVGSDASQNFASWLILDTERDPFNVSNNTLWANKSAAEDKRGDGSTAVGSLVDFDILSNGFKLRQGNVETNRNAITYVYAAFAENPFQANGGLAR